MTFMSRMFQAASNFAHNASFGFPVAALLFNNFFSVSIYITKVINYCAL